MFKAVYIVREFAEAISLGLWKYAVDNFAKKAWPLLSSMCHGIDLDQLFCKTAWYAFACTALAKCVDC